jgi:hypothetical protein
MTGTRDEYLFLARLAEQMERYDDMVEYMKSVASMPAELNQEERNLLSVAFKESVVPCRTTRKVLLDEREEPHVLLSDYKQRLEAELQTKCAALLSLLDSHLIPKASTFESRVFFMKMKGDYYRYLAEAQHGEHKTFSASEAKAAYAAALVEAESAGSYSPAHPTRLGLALNYSVFYNEVLIDVASALTLARSTCAQAEADMSNVPEEQRSESEQVLQLLRDNIQLWTSLAKDTAEMDGTAVEDL